MSEHSSPDSRSQDSADEDGDRAQSSFRLEISLAIGYQRRRARLASRLEANVTSLALLAGGIVLTLLFVYGILSRLGAFG